MVTTKKGPRSREVDGVKVLSTSLPRSQGKNEHKLGELVVPTDCMENSHGYTG